MIPCKTIEMVICHRNVIFVIVYKKNSQYLPFARFVFILEGNYSYLIINIVLFASKQYQC